MATLTPYLFFEGNAAEAMQFYKSVFGGELVMQKVSESPVKDNFPQELQNYILHSELRTPKFPFFASDLCDGSKAIQGNTVELCIVCESKEELEIYWSKLIEGGKVNMEKKEEFFGTFGALHDKFGIGWMLQYSSEVLNEKIEGEFTKA